MVLSLAGLGILIVDLPPITNTATINIVGKLLYTELCTGYLRYGRCLGGQLPLDESPAQDIDTNDAETGHVLSQRSPRLTGEERSKPAQSATLFANPFSIEDLLVFDDAAMQHMLSTGCLRPTLEDLAWSMHGASKALSERVRNNLPLQERTLFEAELLRPITRDQVEAARQQVLDGLFWELTYWKTPELYEELTEGEQLHPGIFQQLEPDLRGKTVLDAGAGSGRASFECIRHGASMVYAVEPSPGLLRILERKLASLLTGVPGSRIEPCQGRFDQVPLEDNCVDVSLSCSAFTAEPGQGGEAGLTELKRVTKPGGKIVIIWPRREDYDWLVGYGFQHVVLPLDQEMRVRFRSMPCALRCARLFYAHNTAVASYILERGQPEVPFSVLGFNPPRDYCWLVVT